MITGIVLSIILTITKYFSFKKERKTTLMKLKETNSLETYLENNRLLGNVEKIAEYVEYNEFDLERKEKIINELILENTIKDSEVKMFIEYGGLDEDILNRKSLITDSDIEKRVINYYLNPPNKENILVYSNTKSKIEENIVSSTKKDMSLIQKLDVLKTFSEKTLELQKISN